MTLPRGRDCEEGQWLTWLLSRPICAELNHSLQTLTGKHMETSDQHLRDHEWSTPARMARDAKDLQINLDALILYPPFTDDPSLRSITSGIVAATNVNVDDARAIGMIFCQECFERRWTMTHYHWLPRSLLWQFDHQ